MIATGPPTSPPDYQRTFYASIQTVRGATSCCKIVQIQAKSFVGDLSGFAFTFHDYVRAPDAPSFPRSTKLAMPDIGRDDPDSLRVLSRSPHPYHRHSLELHEPSDRLVHRPGRRIPVDNAASEPFPSLGSLVNSTTASDSGTEADDEHFLKGLPAPKARLHKGLRGQNEPLSGSSTPLLSPAVMEEEGRKRASGINQGDKRAISERIRRRRELVRRLAEMLLLGFQGGMIAVNPQVQPALRVYQESMYIACKEFRSFMRKPVKVD